MDYIKSPFNWVGNKYKHLDEINKVIKNKNYNKIIDVFMGSGNILFNLECKSKYFIGNDKIKLLPYVYNELWGINYTYTLWDIENILNRFERFSKKENYYTYRDYWNKKYLSNDFDKDFIMETILLLKMCSNSMVRFNPKEGYFNQGFRGLGKKEEFFTDTMKNLCVNEINKLKEHINKEKYKFTNIDFLNYIDEENNNLLILDPPYILRKDMYDTDWSQEHDDKLINLISNTKNDFIYFNYIERDGIVNQNLLNLIHKHNFKVIHINNKTLAGQGRNKNIKEVKEVIVTNV